MNHPNEDTLLLLAYGELPIEQAAELESHVAECESCRAVFCGLERARVALDGAMPRVVRRRLDWTAVALAAAAVAAAVLMIGPRRGLDSTVRWTPLPTLSPTAGYIAGGRAMIDIDVQLTQLERGWRASYERP